MQLHLLYFARLREALGCAAETLTVPPSVRTVQQLYDHLVSTGGRAALATVHPLRCAVNQELVADFSVRLHPGDEVAFFPPVTGG